MRSIAIVLLVLICLVFTGPAKAGMPATYAIVDVNVVPMDEERVITDRSVVVADGRIQAIHSASEWEPAGDMTVIDGEGAYLMPGLAEMHAHVPGSDAPMQLRKDILFLYLANGITLTRGMLGEPWHLELREQLTEGEITGPRLITSGPSLNGNSVESPEQGARMVREQAEAGYDFLKLHPGLDRERFDAIVAAADETGMPFAGHVSVAVGLDRALEAGYASIDHLDRYIRPLVDSETIESVDAGFFDYRLAPHADPDGIPALAERTREAGVWNVPTDSLMQNYLLTPVEGVREARPEFRYLPESMVAQWIERIRNVRESENYDREAAEAYMALRRQLIGALHEAGAGLLLGSDAPQVFNVPGFSIHDEMRLMAEAGLSPFEVLQTGTVNPARFFDAEEGWGQVREGMRAELLLVEGNPLADLDNVSKIRGVMTANGWLGREDIEDGLAAIEERYSR